MQLVGPVADDLVLCGGVADLVLVDFVAAGRVAVHVEDHGGAGDS